MAEGYVIPLLLILLATSTSSQFFDFPQGFQYSVDRFADTQNPIVRNPTDYQNYKNRYDPHSFDDKEVVEYNPIQYSLERTSSKSHNSREYFNGNTQVSTKKAVYEDAEHSTKRNTETTKYARRTVDENDKTGIINFASFIDVESNEDGSRKFFNEPIGKRHKDQTNAGHSRTSSTTTNKKDTKDDRILFIDNTASNSHITTKKPNTWNKQNNNVDKVDTNDFVTTAKPTYISFDGQMESSSYDRPKYQTPLTTKRPNFSTTKKRPSHQNIGSTYNGKIPSSNYEESTTKRKQENSYIYNNVNEYGQSLNNNRVTGNVHDNHQTSTNRRPIYNNNNDNSQTGANDSNGYYENSNKRPLTNKDNSQTSNNFDRPNNGNFNKDDTRTQAPNRRPSNTVGGQSGLVNRPGDWKPNVNENRQPISNKPLYVNVNTAANPSTENNIASDLTPEVMIGLDEAYMSTREKQSAIQKSEQMCEQYKKLGTAQVAAIPLVPYPSPALVTVPTCARSSVPLIVGGKAVTITEFPHMAALGWDKVRGGGYSWKCGGSLVSEQHVLTAAHCTFQERDNSAVEGPPRVVQLGSAILDDPSATIVRVTKAIRHPKYKSPASYYDVALLKLARKLSFSDTIRPACIGDPPSAGESIIATGWGRTEFGGEQSQELRGVSLPVWDMKSCRQALSTSRKIPDGPSEDSQLCAGEVQGGKDTCQGDSGGPAQVAEECTWRVLGVTSMGRACGAPRSPALYALSQRVFVITAMDL